MAFIDDVQRYLVAQNIGTDPPNRQTWPIYKFFLPDDDLDRDRAIMLMEVPGTRGPSQWDVLYSRVIIYARGNTDYDIEATRQKVYDAFNALHATTTEVDSKFRSVLATDSAPIYLGTDSKKRPLFSWALDCIYEETDD